VVYRVKFRSIRHFAKVLVRVRVSLKNPSVRAPGMITAEYNVTFR
jgi:hypothetical protein